MYATCTSRAKARSAPTSATYSSKRAVGTPSASSRYSALAACSTRVCRCSISLSFTATGSAIGTLLGRREVRVQLGGEGRYRDLALRALRDRERPGQRRSRLRAL